MKSRRITIRNMSKITKSVHNARNAYGRRGVAGLGVLVLALAFTFTCCDFGACAHAPSEKVSKAERARGDCHGKKASGPIKPERGPEHEPDHNDCGNCDAKNIAERSTQRILDQGVIAFQEPVREAIFIAPAVHLARVQTGLSDIPPPDERLHVLLQSFLI